MRHLSRLRVLLLVGFGLGLGIFVAGIAMVWMGPLGTPDYDVDSGGFYFSKDADLGNAPRPGISVRSSRDIDSQTVYDVRYTIDESGLRETPSSTRQGPATLFFGGSFTFGEGLEDTETLPARVAQKDPGRRALNAGFHGYGPHQMLRALETDRLRELTPAGVEDVVYLAIDSHVDRVGGRVSWNFGAPRYVLEDGSPSFAGPMYEGLERLALRIGRRVPVLDDWVRQKLAATEEQAQSDRELYVAILLRAAELVREKWDVPLTVVFWDQDGGALADRLAASGLETIRVSRALEGRPWSAFTIPRDGHPSAAANEAVANHLLEHWSRREPLDARK